jgi:hypothetical protein
MISRGRFRLTLNQHPPSVMAKAEPTPGHDAFQITKTAVLNGAKIIFVFAGIPRRLRQL